MYATDLNPVSIYSTDFPEYNEIQDPNLYSQEAVNKTFGRASEHCLEDSDINLNQKHITTKEL